MQEDANLNGIGDACEGLDQGSGLASIVVAPQTFSRFVGDKRYELSNHLGNVLSVVSDRKLFQNSLSLTTFAPDVLSYSDYYPFGMLVPNRHKSSEDYRYGFQGQEKDDEIRGGEGNSLNYTFRMHDPRVGRFFAVDPLMHEYPWYSPYVFSGNRVMDMVELEGLEPKKKGFWASFGESVEKGVIKVVNYAANNPNNAGYGYNPNLKAPSQSDLAKYEINWKEQLDPTWQIKNFSSKLVYGFGGFVGGIYNKDGEQTAQAIPLLLDAIGTIQIMKGGFSFKK